MLDGNGMSMDYDCVMTVEENIAVFSVIPLPLT